MGTSYLVKDKVFAVCTYQLSADPEKFSNTRTTPTVFYQNDKQPILTVADRNLNCQFTCKSPWNNFTEFDYIFNVTYSVESRTNTLLGANVLLNEKIKNNIEAITKFKIHQVEL